MKNITTFFLFAAAIVFMTACSSNNKQERKLYIEEGEYEAEMAQYAPKERRASAPVVESNYFFRVLPQDTYYFDERNMPVEDAVKTTVQTKKEPRLQKRPKRYLADGFTPKQKASPAPAAPQEEELEDDDFDSGAFEDFGE